MGHKSDNLLIFLGYCNSNCDDFKIIINNIIITINSFL